MESKGHSGGQSNSLSADCDAQSANLHLSEGHEHVAAHDCQLWQSKPMPDASQRHFSPKTGARELDGLADLNS